MTWVNEVEYTYDNRGNLTHDGVYTYTWNAAGRLMQAQSVTHTLAYTYNGDGVRVAGAADGAETRYVQDVVGLPQVLLETTGGETTLYLNGYSRLAQVQGDDAEWVLGDALGSARQLVDDDGAVVLARDYDPYGQLLSESGTSNSGYGFTGEQFDRYTDMLFLRARWHSLYLGRFVSADSTIPDFSNPQSLNRYTYVLNRPTDLVDPNGEFPLLMVLGGAVTSAYMTYVSGDGGYSGQLTLHTKREYYLYNTCSWFILPRIGRYSWGAKSGDMNRSYDPIEPNIYVVDPSMRRRNDSFGRGVCIFDWCPLGRKWNEDAWGKERLSLKYESGQGSPYFIHGGNENRGSAGCIKLKNDDLKETLDRIQLVGKPFKLYIERDYSTPPPPDWYGGVVEA